MSAEDQENINDLVVWKANVCASVRKLRKLHDEAAANIRRLEAAVESRYRARLASLRKEQDAQRKEA